MTTAAMSPAAITRDQMGLWHATPSGRLLVTPLVTEDLLASAFLRFSSEGLVDRIWQEGVPSLSWFLKQYSRENGVQMLACLKEDENQRLTPCGLSWICSKVAVANTLTKCEVGEAFFRHTNPSDTLDFGKMSLDYIFEDLGVDVAYGTTAEKNRVAVRYARAMGFEMFGPIPKYTTWKNKVTGEYDVCGIWISCMTKERWEVVQNGWR